MDECLQALSQQREWEGDDLLVAQVKIQLITEQLTRANAQSPDGIPPDYVLAALRTQLQSTQAQLPVHLQQNGMSFPVHAPPDPSDALKTRFSATYPTRNLPSTRSP